MTRPHKLRAIRSYLPAVRCRGLSGLRPGRTARRLALLLVMSACGVDTTVAKGSASTAGIDLETANRLVREYAAHVATTLPRDWRQAEEEKWRDEPPHIPPGGIFQLLSPGGQIAFEHDPEKGRLLCWALIHKVRGDYPRIGLTRQEILTGLERAVAGGVGTGGGEMVYDEVSDGYFLLRAYDRPPKKTRQLIKELDRLTAAGEKWFRRDYLESVLSYAKTLRPPASATARDGDFAVTLVLTPDKRYHDLWHNPPGGSQPQLVSRSEYSPGQDVWAMALFTGATAGDDGAARYEAQYTFVYPSGEAAGSKVFKLWDGPPPPPDHLQMVEDKAGIEIGEGSPAGHYLARVKVCNASTGRCVTAETPFRVLAGSGS